MKPPSNSGISVEDLQGDDALPRLLQGLNPFMAQTVAALSGQLGWENFRAELKTLNVKVPEAAWIAPTLQNSWANSGGTETPAGYRIDPGGRVWVRGAVTGGTRPGIIFTLPVGYRPPYNFGVELATSGAAAVNALFVNPAGEVTLGTGTDNTWVHLGNFSFLATNPAPPAAFTGSDWPLLFSTKVPEPKLVIPIAVQDAQASAKTTFGGPTLDWERTGDGRIKIKSLHGLTPGRAYKVTVLITGG